MFQRIAVFLYTLSVSLLVPGIAMSQESDSLSYQLDDVVAIGKKSVSEETSSTPFQNVDRTEIDRLGLRELSDAVKRMSGVDVRDYGGVGGLKTVSVRGMGAKHTAVSYDGAVVSDARSGMVDLGRFSLENVSAVSLTIGQGDEISLRTARDYSLASMLSVKSNAIPAGYSSYVKMQGGSFGFANFVAYGGYSNNDRTFAASLCGNYLRSDGAYPFDLVNGNVVTKEKRSDSDVESMMFEGNVKAALFNGHLSAKLHYYGSERGLPGAVNLYNKENRERLWNRNFFAQTVYDFTLSEAADMRVVAKYDHGYSRYKEINKNYASGEQVDVNRQNEFYLSLAMANSRHGKFNYSVAADVAYASLENNFENSSSPRRFSSYTVLAMQYSFRRASLTASLLATYINDDVRSAASPAPYRRLSPALAFSLKPFEGSSLRLRASVKDSYRVPTFADLYYLRHGNTALKPERATLYNVGVMWSESYRGFLKSVGITVDAYYNSVRDKIVALPTMYIWRMMNFGKADIYGVDVNLSARIGISRRVALLADANYSWQRAMDVTDSSAKNYRDQLPYTPEHSGNLSFTVENPVLNVSYMLSAVGERYMLPQNTVYNRMDGYFEHSFSLYKELALGSARLRLQGELLNVADNRYEIIRYYPMPGFQWRVSARLSF